MPQRVYEGMFLFDSNKYARNPNEVSAAVTDAIEKCGGEILVSRLWAEQKLAYPINGQRKGTYWLTYFRMDSQRREELNRAFRLNTDILRELVLAVDKRLVDTLVEHASGVTKANPPKTDAPPASDSSDNTGDSAEDVPAAVEEAEV